MKLSVCIPMYNESAVIADTAKTLSDYMASHFEEYEILFSDDGSRDGSAEIVKSLQLPNVRVLEQPINQGKGAAVRVAMLEACGDYRIFTDADLAYGTDVIERIANTFTENPDSDLVIGSRNLEKDGYEGYTFSRKLASKLYIRALCIAGGFRMSDSQCGCKAFSAKAAETIFSRCKVNGFSFDFEALLWAESLNMKITEIPVCVLNHRQSKIRLLRDSIRMLSDVLRIKREVRKAAKTEEKKK